MTNLPLNAENAYEIARAGRTRWRVGNELFNIIKNKGYNLEHSYGHGKQYSCSTLGGLMLLAYLIDEVQEVACRFFEAAYNAYHARIILWERMRALVFHIQSSQLGIVDEGVGGSRLFQYGPAKPGLRITLCVKHNPLAHPNLDTQQTYNSLRTANSSILADGLFVPKTYVTRQSDNSYSWRGVAEPRVLSNWRVGVLLICLTRIRVAK